MYGFGTSNYGGITTTWLNPVNFIDSRYQMDFNISGAELFLQNNFFYMPAADYRFGRFLKKNPSFPEYPNYFNNVNHPYKVYYNELDKSLFCNIRYAGPGMGIRLNRFSVGIMTYTRFVASMDHVPWHVMEFLIDGTGYKPIEKTNLSSKPFDAGLLGFYEADLNFAYRVCNNEDIKVSAGINLKYLNSFSAAYVRLRSFDYYIPVKELLQTSDIAGDYGYSFPMERSRYSVEKNGFYNRGTGSGFDVGFSVYRTAKNIYYSRRYYGKNQNSREYLYKFSLSFLDMGFVNIRKGGMVMQYNHERSNWSGVDTFKGHNLYHIDTSASYYLKGSAFSSIYDSVFRIRLPFSVVLQAEFNPLNHFFFNTLFYYGFRSAQPAVRHPFVMAFTPRYEKKEWGIFLPLTFYDRSLLKVGFGFRFFSYFYAGTDKLGMFFNISDLTGLDFYCGFKYGIYPPSANPSPKIKRSKSKKCPTL